MPSLVTSLVQPIVLAGGAGTRLWPVSTRERPKHLLPLVGDATLLEQTLGRLTDSSLFSSPTIVCAAPQAEEVAALAPDAGLILEPCARSSAAAVALAALASDPESVLLVLPSDHHIGDPESLREAVRRALPAAESGRLVTFGINPARAETGYGYITAGEEIGRGVFEARWFIEKPAREVAERLIASGDSYWNAGIFLFKANAFLEELERHAPEIAEAAKGAVANATHSHNRLFPTGQALESCPSISIDYAVMERSDKVVVVPVELDWSDVGSWATIFDLAPKDEAGNVLDERSRALDSSGCLLRSTGPRIVAVGVADLVVVATAEHVLVVPRQEAQRVREAAELASREVTQREERSRQERGRGKEVSGDSGQEPS